MAHLLIVTGAFYADLANELRRGARAALDAAGASYDEAEVPGALEIPQAVAYGIAAGKYDGFIALGAVIRGETAHYDIVAGESARALMDLAVRHNVPVGNGILTTETMQQAQIRAAADGKNKGGDAARAVLKLLEIKAGMDR